MSYSQQPQIINPTQFSNSPYLNGHTRTVSPAYQQPTFQTNALIPAKRSREDSLAASPRSAPAGPPSRTHTPGQLPYNGVLSQTNGAPNFANSASSLQHLQPNNNPSPSPTMQQMGFQNGGGPRMSTASPNPFSPQNNVAAGSPAHSDHASRMGTPLELNNNMMQKGNMNMVMNTNFNAQQFNPAIAGQMGMNQMNMAQQQMAQQQNYQMQLQAHQQTLQRLGNQQRSMNNTMNGHHISSQQPVKPSSMRSLTNSSPADFFRSLQTFMTAKGRQINLKPMICGRPLDNIMRLYQAVSNGGGSSQITKMNKWDTVALHIGYPPQQLSQAAAELQAFWLNNIAAFEQMWMAEQYKQRMMAQKQANMKSPVHTTQQLPATPMHQRQDSDLSMTKMRNLPNNSNHFSPVKEPAQSPTHYDNASLTGDLDNSDLGGINLQNAPEHVRSTSMDIKAELELEDKMPRQEGIEDPFVPEVLQPSQFHGPINVSEIYGLGSAISELKPTAPRIRELGVIDIHAIILSIKSGIHAEVRNALDILVQISCDAALQLQLDQCEDLIEAIVDYAQVEVDFLAEHASEVSDEISLPSYEELVRACSTESTSLQRIPEFGSLDYDLDRSADRLVCITTLLRNFSFFEPNFEILGQSEVVQLITRVIQSVGTKDALLRSYKNTLDFAKDIVIYLSNLSTILHLPTKQDALCLTHFLTSFAPQPAPIMPAERLLFATYVPSVHKYLPPAIDSLAKLLARDEPNRGHFKHVFGSDKSYELLTKVFAMAISPVPNVVTTGDAQGKPSPQFMAQNDARRPFMLQGLLIAETLVSFLPGSEQDLTRKWLQSADCWASNLTRMAEQVASYAHSKNMQHQRPLTRDGRVQLSEDKDPSGCNSLVIRVMTLLKLLVMRSRSTGIGISKPEIDTGHDRDNLGNHNLGSVLLSRETILETLQNKDMDIDVLHSLCSYIAVDDGL